ncbi:barstar family protein [Amycolatopsis sp. NBC_01286]|uniref:barstar family protein n=1 Tax=Amycolatopsis sp. NBC_01286 TaxID=2903560 RepID=UPI002E105665|nr:barstar family protein [Amycolatopsis sp. NBC_01286]
MEISPGIIALPEKEVRALYREFRSGGYRVYLLETGFNADREAFFSAVQKTLPLDPPLVSSRSWEALSDSLWEGLVALAESKVVIAWPDAHRMMSVSPYDYEIAVSVMGDVISSLCGPRSSGNPVTLAIYTALGKESS